MLKRHHTRLSIENNSLYFYFIDADVDEVVKLLSSTEISVDEPDKVEQLHPMSGSCSFDMCTAGWDDCTDACSL